MGLSGFDVTAGIIIHTAELPERVSAIMGVQQSQRHNLRISCDNKVCEAENYIWIYRICYEDQVDVEKCITRFLSSIPELPSKIAEVQEIGECVLRVSIVSVYAQLGFSLSPNMLKEIYNLDIPIEITILSFGNCIDEEVEG